MTRDAPAAYRQRLLQARQQAGLTQRDLAERIGCSDSTVSFAERGARDLSAGYLIAWAHACSVSLDWVAGDDVPMARHLVELEGSR